MDKMSQIKSEYEIYLKKHEITNDKLNETSLKCNILENELIKEKEVREDIQTHNDNFKINEINFREKIEELQTEKEMQIEKFENL